MSANQQNKRGKTVKAVEASQKVVVAVKASKEIPKTVIVWALTHVVQPGDCIMLLVVVTPHISAIEQYGDIQLSHEKGVWFSPRDAAQKVASTTQ